MNIQAGFFYVFSTVLVLSAFGVITVRNPVHAVLCLVLAFFQAAMIWMLLKAEFLAISLVLVYVGAVMVLFLFVVMMLDVDARGSRENFWRHFPLAAVVGGFIIVEMGAVLLAAFPNTDAADAGAAVAGYSNTKELGKLLYTDYLYPLEVAAAILLVAMIAAIALTLRQRKDTRAMAGADQIRVKASDRLKVVSMEPTLPAPTGSEKQS